jgi:hypothetical protein
MSKWQHEVANYATDLGQFVKNERLPIEWFMQPDHIALKAYNAAGFEKLLHEVRDGDPGAEDITIAEMDGRRLATAFMAGPIALGPFREVEIVEIMEPRLEKIGKDKVGLDHVEFLQPDFAVVQRRLFRTGMSPEVNHNSSHSFLSITFGKDHHELKFTDKSLADIVGRK